MSLTCQITEIQLLIREVLTLDCYKIFFYNHFDFPERYQLLSLVISYLCSVVLFLLIFFASDDRVSRTTHRLEMHPKSNISHGRFPTWNAICADPFTITNLLGGWLGGRVAWFDMFLTAYKCLSCSAYCLCIFFFKFGSYLLCFKHIQ